MRYWARSPGPYNKLTGRDPVLEQHATNRPHVPKAKRTDIRQHGAIGGTYTYTYAKHLFTPHQLAYVVAVKATAATALTTMAHEDFVLLIHGQVHHSRRAQHLKR